MHGSVECESCKMMLFSSVSCSKCFKILFISLGFFYDPPSAGNINTATATLPVGIAAALMRGIAEMLLRNTLYALKMACE